MKVGKSVSKAISEWAAGDLESSMLHACNAVDGTARKQGFASRGNKERFLRLLRSNYDILGPIGIPGISIEETRFFIRITDRARPVLIDLAEVIYRVHRCTHGHGDELPDGFGLLPDANGPPRHTRLEMEKSGKLRLSDRLIFGMLAVAVVDPKNSEELANEDQYLTFDGGAPLMINEWWGRRTEFATIVRAVQLPSVKLDLSNWVREETNGAHRG